MYSFQTEERHNKLSDLGLYSDGLKELLICKNIHYPL